MQIEAHCVFETEVKGFGNQGVADGYFEQSGNAGCEIFEVFEAQVMTGIDAETALTGGFRGGGFGGGGFSGGGGGGRPNMAQAGGKNPDKIPEAIAAVAGILEDQIK